MTFISPDTLTEQGSKGEEQVFYRVQVEVDISQMRPRRTGEVIELQPGMVAMVEIKTGENTVLRYLLKPLVKTLDNALSER